MGTLRRHCLHRQRCGAAFRAAGSGARDGRRTGLRRRPSGGGPQGNLRVTANALTFDVEDWHQLVEWKLNGVLPASSGHVLAQTYDILEMLAVRNVRATFFILGLIADAHPQLVKDIASAGHEIGSHGWSHQLIYRQERGSFAAETKRSKDVLEQTIGAPVYGYRAAEFSITSASLWALDVIAESGFRYDSSIFPFA